MKDTSTWERTLLKAFSWESISNLVCFALAYLVFGSLGGCAIFTLVCFAVKLVLFLVHERLWHQIPWGKTCNP